MAKASTYILKNAEAVFLVPKGITGKDDLGNTIELRDRLIYELKLTRSRNAKGYESEGVDSYISEWVGNCLNPSILDPRVKEGTKCEIMTKEGVCYDCVVTDTDGPTGTTGVINEILNSVVGHPISIARLR